MTDISQITMDGWSQQSTTFTFDLLDETLVQIGEIPVMGSASVENNINRTIKRQMSDVTLPPSALDDINMLADRVRPNIIFADGSKYPLGVFVFTDSSMTRETFGTSQFVGADSDSGIASVTLHDQMTLLDIPYDLPIALRPGTLIADALDVLMNRVSQWSPGISWVIPDIDTAIRGTEWFVRPPSTNLLEAMNDLGAMAGMYSVYADNSGVFQFTVVPEIDDDPAFVYAGGTNVFADSIVESTDLLAIPNRYIVINSALTDTPIFGMWDVPSEAEYSIENRGRVVPHIDDLQGIDNNTQAIAAAKASATRDASAYEWVDFDATPDPRHDTFDLVEWNGHNFREQSWRLTLAPGGVHHHELRRTYDPDDEPPEEG